VLVLGEDVWNTAPILALGLRQAARVAPNRAASAKMRISPWDDAALREAVQNQKGPFFVATPEGGELDTFAKESYRGAPEDIARLGYAVAHAIDPAAPAPAGLGAEAAALAQAIAAALVAAETPLVVSGSALGSPTLVEAAASVCRALKAAGRSPLISLVFPEANTLGASLLGPRGLEAAAREMGEGRPLVVAEADLFRAGPELAAALLGKAKGLIVLDHSQTATARAADLVLPVAALGEGSGSFVSSEGRAQRFFAVFKPEAPIAEAWRWLGLIAHAAGRAAKAWDKLDEIHASIAAELPALARLSDAAPGGDWRFEGQRIGRGPHRESGRTALAAHIDVHEAEPPKDPDSGLAYTMEGEPRSQPSSLVPRFWAPGWNSDQSVNKFQVEVNGALYGGDPGARLFEPGEDRLGYAGLSAPPAFAPRKDALLALPRFHAFGSDELSSLAPAVRQRIEEAHVAVSAKDAERLGLAPGARVRLGFVDGGETQVLRLVVRDMGEGLASLPVGFEGVPALGGPAWVRIEAAE
ncbi:MAG TPA: molybdopterin-dependent oxidoreductase, partial [Rectinemataceae bacterium]|nr:molybdopterin-dependent oxidoreductase [Rectinemataceae bacterium]